MPSADPASRSSRAHQGVYVRGMFLGVQEKEIGFNSVLVHLFERSQAVPQSEKHRYPRLLKSPIISLG